MSVATETPARSEENFRVTRSRRNVAWTGAGALIVVVVLALFPYIVYSGTTTIMVQAFIVLTLASMWNLLAGYAGLVSVGQQAFVGLGAYFVLILALHGISPFAALPVAAIGCGVAAVPLWWLVSRLRSGYFAIATWVLATTVMLHHREVLLARQRDRSAAARPVRRTPRRCSPPTPTGSGWPSRSSRWPPCTCCCAAGWAWCSPPSGTTRWPPAARERGSAWSGCSCSWWPGSAAARLARYSRSASSRCSPSAVFSVQWTAEMAFATIIGGLGTIEGPILGTVVYILLQQTLASYNAWYLIILGLVAIAIALFARRGLWGLVDDHLHVRLFPVGYWLWAPGSSRRRGLGRLRGRGGKHS